MRKPVALLMAVLLCLGLFVPMAGAEGVELRVVSSFSGTDGSRPAFEKAFKAWEAETGNTIIDESQTSDEVWKAKVLADFETGADPDVLFFFNNVDSNAFVEAGKVVPLETILAEYPEYGSNMNFDSIPASPVDGKQYTLPAQGFWEGLFVNKNVLAAAGVEMPTAETTWDEFITICQSIKDAGYIPISVSLQQIPHYWFEFTIMNNGGPANQLNIPAEAGDATAGVWAGALNDIKQLYELGFFPEDTLTASDEETCRYIYDDKAAFLIDGSWKVGQFLQNVGEERLGEFDLTYVPSKGDRKPTDIIGGLSMGWYITEKAWADETKRDTCVSFIQALTSDAVVNEMAAGTAVTALKTPQAAMPEGMNLLQQAAFKMISGTTSVVPAVQDYIKPEAKAQILETDTKLVAAGEITAEEAVANMIEANK